MGSLPSFSNRFLGRRAASGFSRPSRSGPTSPRHQSFRLTRPAKEKMITRAVGSYLPQAVKKELKGLEEQIVHAVGRGDKTFIDQDGVEHEISKEMRFFAKEARQGGHTLTKKSEVQDFGEGFIETAREEGMKLRSGYNIGTEKDVAKKLVATEEKANQPTESHDALRAHRAHHQDLNAMRQRLGLAANSSEAVSPAHEPSSPSIQPLPVAPLPSVNRPVSLVSGGMSSFQHEHDDHQPDAPTVVAATNDPISEENQAIAESIPPANDVSLPDTTNIDRGLPF